MKKLFLSLAVLAAVTMVSCGSSEKKAQDEGAAIKAKIENCTNPDSLKIYVQQAQDYAAKLVSEGKDEAANAYLQEVAPAVEAKDAAAASVFTQLEQKADSAVVAAKDAAKEIADSASSKVEAAKDATKDAVEAAKDKASDVASSAKDKASEVAGNAADAVKAGADKVKGALGK